jgi:hypothetical protein
MDKTIHLDFRYEQTNQRDNVYISMNQLQVVNILTIYDKSPDYTAKTDLQLFLFSFCRHRYL